MNLNSILSLIWNPNSFITNRMGCFELILLLELSLLEMLDLRQLSFSHLIQNDIMNDERFIHKIHHATFNEHPTSSIGCSSTTNTNLLALLSQPKGILPRLFVRPSFPRLNLMLIPTLRKLKLNFLTSDS
jgi:hypothetical protein